MKIKTLFLILGSLLVMTSCSGEKKAPAPPPPPDVSVIETRAQDVPLFLEFVGQTAGLKDIAIRARVEGFLEGIHFQEGSNVNNGDLLYTLESQPFVLTPMLEAAGYGETVELSQQHLGTLVLTEES